MKISQAMTPATRRFARDRDLICSLVREVAISESFILKEAVQALEGALAERSGYRHAVAVSSQSDGLSIVLRANGCGVGSQVLLPAFGACGILASVFHLHAAPRLLDVDAKNGMELIGDFDFTPKAQSRAVVMMDFGTAPFSSAQTAHERAEKVGRSFILWSSLDVGDRQRATLAQTGASVHSLSPSRPWGGVGEAGLILTNDEGLAQRCRRLRNHGQDGITRFLHHELGYNHRMDEVNARYLLWKESQRSEELSRIEFVKALYEKFLFRRNPLLREYAPRGQSGPTWGPFLVQGERMLQLREHLRLHSIPGKISDCEAVLTHPRLGFLAYERSHCPNAEAFEEQVVALPLYGDLGEVQVKRISEIILRFYERPS